MKDTAQGTTPCAAEEHRETPTSMRRRGMIAAAVAVAAGMVAKQTTQPVSAHDTQDLFLNNPNVTSDITSINASAATGDVTAFVMFDHGGNPGGVGSPGTGSLGAGLAGGPAVVGGGGVAGFAKIVSDVAASDVAGLIAGVYGQATSHASSAGVKGVVPAGTVGATTVGVFGANLSTAVDSHGIIGLSQGGHGLVGTCNAHPSGGNFYAGLVGLAGVSDANAGNFYGNVQITGTLNGHSAIMVHSQVAVAHPDGAHRLAQPVVSPEGWMEDVGEGTLANGQAAVRLDPAFAAVVDTNKYHGFLTAHGDYNLHVAEMKADGFVVRVTSGASAGQPTGGAPVGVSQVAKASNVAWTFSWKVMAKRKDGQAERLATYTFPKLVAPTIAVPTGAAAGANTGSRQGPSITGQ